MSRSRKSLKDFWILKDFNLEFKVAKKQKYWKILHIENFSREITIDNAS